MKSESLIVKFFENTLSEAERQEFDALMASDEDFKKEVAFRKELTEVITLDDRETIKQELQGLDQPKINRKPWLWPVAASVILLLGISTFWFLGNKTATPQALFDAHFEPYNNVVHPIVRGDSTDLKTEAFIAYEAKNYEEALNAFNTLLNEHTDATILFYKANVLMQLNANEEAILILKDNSDIPEILKQQQQWYLALAYIKAKANEKAKSTLKALIKSSSYKQKEAEKLLKQLPA